ncbi:MAG: PD40 domain-containing protein [Calditrichaceae bacterium]|nr:PD40 domain-containing protein [Calditrichaceae bacterium]
MHHKSKYTFFISLLLFVWLIVFLTDNSILYAQGFHFGRNKVQYTQFDWQILKTDHFDIYYYPEMRDMAEKGAKLAEESYAVLETKFNFSVTKRIPLIFYSSHLHFQQTNVTPGFIPEGVGGFFEFSKNRVVIPGNGDLNQFKHVIRHELVHVFMHRKILNISRKYDTMDISYPPLWFVEGLAEFWSSKWDSRAEMVLKDAVLNNYNVGLENIYIVEGTFTMYKIGQHVLEYIADQYGEDKILRLLDNSWKFDRFEKCFQYVLGVDYKTFDQDYLYHLKKKYYPKLAEEDFNIQIDETIVRKGYNFKPVYYEQDGRDYVVFTGNRTGYSSIYMRPIEGLALKEKEHVETLVEGEATSDFESFHLFDSKIDVTKDGRIAFSSKSGETDALFIYDIRSHKVLSKHYFDDIAGIISPGWSPNGRDIAFSGLNVNGFKDIYIFNSENGNIQQLTNDIYNDLDPVWSPDGKHIAFASDRTEFGDEGCANIFLYTLKTQSIYYLTYGRQSDKTPSFSPDGNYLAYTSDRSGSENLYLIKNPLQTINNNKPVQMLKMSSYVGSTFDPAWTRWGGLLYSTFENMSFQIRHSANFLEKIDSAEVIEERIIPFRQKHWSLDNIASSEIDSSVNYVRKYDLDFAQTQVSQDPIYGTTGGALFAISDMLGNDQYYFVIYNNAQTSGDFWKSFNVAATKVSLGNRINYAIGLYRFAGYYYNPQDAYYYEESVGAQLTVSYPFSHFSRLDYTQLFTYSDKDWFVDKRRYAYLTSSYLSYVHDNSIWMQTGPIDGHRINITFGNTYDFAFSEVNYLTGLIDLRKYFRITTRSAYAIRVMSMFNEGREIRQFYFGGSWDLRGYRRWSLRGKRLFLVSQEFRFPMADLVGVRFPFGSIGLNGIRGALFFDAGNAWNDNLEELKGSFGVGVRFRFAGFLVLRWDLGRKTDFKDISGYTFNHFFFGWDF